jgi:hypothetical protein
MKINFISNRPWLTSESSSSPIPTIKNIPEGYKKYDRYAKDSNGVEYKDHDGGKIPTWKACPAIYDIMGTGYVLRTPCDINFIEHDGNLIAKIENPMYQDFIQYRNEMPGFMHPEGYRTNHFAWFPDWAPSVPEGYSVLYSHPFNRFDLPFLNTSGIVDNDCVDIPGTMPFFIKNGWSGLIPEGTPYMQLLPFKRDDWESGYIELDEKEIVRRNLKNSKRYRKPSGGVYLNETWNRRKYS